MPDADDHEATAGCRPTIAQVMEAVRHRPGILPSRRRDLLSACRRMARLLNAEPAQVPVDIPAIRTQLDRLTPVAMGISHKTFQNLIADFLFAIQLSELMPLRRGGTYSTPLSPAWAAVRAQFPDKRWLAVSRLAHWASQRGIDPRQIDDQVVGTFYAQLRSETLGGRHYNAAHQRMARVWNALAARIPMLGLSTLAVPSYKRGRSRIPWSDFPASFRQDVDRFLAREGRSDPFTKGARGRAIAPRTLKMRRDYLHAAANALVQSGFEADSLQSLGQLVDIDAFCALLRFRYETAGRGENRYDAQMAIVLIIIARDWVKVDASVLAELKELAAKLKPRHAPGLTEKNRRRVRQFDDPKVLEKLLRLPYRLWAEAKREFIPTKYTLAKMQAALAIGCLTYHPIRLGNLLALAFDRHVFLRTPTTSTIEIRAEETKNNQEVLFDIQPDLAKMLIEYRDVLGPKVSSTSSVPISGGISASNSMPMPFGT